MSINKLAAAFSSDGEISDYYSEDESLSVSTPQQESEGEYQSFKEHAKCRRLEKGEESKTNFETDSIDLVRVNRHIRCNSVEQDWEDEDCWDDSDLKIEVPLKSVELKVEIPTKVAEYSRRSELKSYPRRNSLSNAAA